MDENSNLFCFNHSKRFGAFYCEQCSVPLCHKCNKLIHMIGINKNHKVKESINSRIEFNNKNDKDDMEDEKNINDQDPNIKEDFEIMEILNDKGCESEVYRGKFGGTECVIKRSKKPTDEDYVKEISLMKRTPHPNIAQCLGYSIDPVSERVMIFYEKLEPSEKHILSNGSGITDLQRLKYVHQLALGFSSLEERKIMHGDIKLPNTLYDRNADKLKICDFGFARDITKDIKGSARGSPLYIAPEVWRELMANKKDNHITYTPKMDVYSFAIMAHSILTGIEYKFNVEMKVLVHHVLFKNQRPNTKILAKYPSSVISIITKCWSDNPSERYTFSEMVKHLNVAFLEMVMTDPIVPKNLQKLSNNEEAKKQVESIRNWLSKFKSEIETQVKIFSIELPEFVKSFCGDLLKIKLPNISDDAHKLLAFLFKKQNGNQLDLDSFSAYMPCFGSLDNGDLWIENAINDVKIEGFYGRITKLDAEKLMTNVEPKKYLLRTSSTKGGWCVSISKGNGKTIHIMIDHSPFSGLYSVELLNHVEVFKSLSDSVNYIKEKYDLTGCVQILPPNTRVFTDDNDLSNFDNYENKY